MATFPSPARSTALSGLDVSPDGRTLAIASGWEVQLGNVATLREVGRFATTAGICSVSFAPDGTALFITEQSANGPVTLIKRAATLKQTDSQL